MLLSSKGTKTTTDWIKEIDSRPGGLDEFMGWEPGHAEAVFEPIREQIRADVRAAGGEARWRAKLRAKVVRHGWNSVVSKSNEKDVERLISALGNPHNRRVRKLATSWLATTHSKVLSSAFWQAFVRVATPLFRLVGLALLWRPRLSLSEPSPPEPLALFPQIQPTCAPNI